MIVMEKPDKPKVKSETPEEELHISPEMLSDFQEDMGEIMPQMNVDEKLMDTEDKPSIVSDDNLMGLYEEILQNCRQDRESIDEVLVNFIDMVMNEGDASSASKEAIVNLMKAKSDINDKMSKIADLETRVKLKERDTFPRYLAAQQNNKVVIEGSKRDMIKSVNKLLARSKNAKPNK